MYQKFINWILKKIFGKTKEDTHFMGVSGNKEKVITTAKHERAGDYCNTCKEHILDCPYFRSDFK